MNTKEELRNLASVAEEIGECLGALLNTHTSIYMHHGAPIIEMAKELVEVRLLFLVCLSHCLTSPLKSARFSRCSLSAAANRRPNAPWHLHFR